MAQGHKLGCFLFVAEAMLGVRKISLILEEFTFNSQDSTKHNLNKNHTNRYGSMEEGFSGALNARQRIICN